MIRLRFVRISPSCKLRSGKITTRTGRPPQKMSPICDSPSSRELHTPFTMFRGVRNEEDTGFYHRVAFNFLARCVYSRLVRRGHGGQLDHENSLIRC